MEPAKSLYAYQRYPILEVSVVYLQPVKNIQTLNSDKRDDEKTFFCKNQLLRSPFREYGEDSQMHLTSILTS
uniref:Uncharacterized protein n=1 Tax=Octopus bimaculoides TaxID=37653 RepID=A0A0L8H3N0_OCTBM